MKKVSKELNNAIDQLINFFKVNCEELQIETIDNQNIYKIKSYSADGVAQQTYQEFIAGLPMLKEKTINDYITGKKDNRIELDTPRGIIKKEYINTFSLQPLNKSERDFIYSHFFININPKLFLSLLTETTKGFLPYITEKFCIPEYKNADGLMLFANHIGDNRPIEVASVEDKVESFKYICKYFEDELKADENGVLHKEIFDMLYQQLGLKNLLKFKEYLPNPIVDEQFKKELFVESNSYTYKIELSNDYITTHFFAFKYDLQTELRAFSHHFLEIINENPIKQLESVSIIENRNPSNENSNLLYLKFIVDLKENNLDIIKGFKNIVEEMLAIYNDALIETIDVDMRVYLTTAYNSLKLNYELNDISDKKKKHKI